MEYQSSGQYGLSKNPVSKLAHHQKWRCACLAALHEAAAIIFNFNIQRFELLEVVSKPQIGFKGPACQRDFASDLFQSKCSASAG